MTQTQAVETRAFFDLPFTKMQGAGNDVVVLNAMHGLPALTPAHFRILGDRRYGVGCDQILMVAPPKHPENDFSYRIVNQDGSEVEHCGNGARCFMRYVLDQGLTHKTSVRVEIARGVITLTLCDDGEVEVNMGVPDFAAHSLPFVPEGLARVIHKNGFVEYAIPVGQGSPHLERSVLVGTVSVGNPHAVCVVGDADTAAVSQHGALIETHAAFANRVNVGFMQVLDEHHIKLRVWERGVGETLACGTGACAAVVVGIQLGLLQSPVQVQARGGTLSVAWQSATNAALDTGADPDSLDPKDILMRGPAVSVYTGSIRLAAQ